MIACDSKYLHCPDAPDRSRWPFDTPSIEIELKRRCFTIANRSSLKSAEVFDATGQRWMHRALNSEAHLRDSVKAAEGLLKRLREVETKLGAYEAI